MEKYFLALAFIAGIMYPSVSRGQGLDDSATLRLNQAVEAFRNKYRSPGVVVAVVHGNEIVSSHSAGFSNPESKTPATIDSKFPIMSITKTFTATMLMQLVEKGTLRLDDKVEKYIPEYKKVHSPFPGSGPTTLFQLATHSAGLPRNTPADIGFKVSLDKWVLNGGKDTLKWFSTNKELLHSLQFVKLEYPPFHYIHHNDRHYSNLGYSLLGIALERAAGTGFRAYVSKHICTPLGMTSSGFLDEPGAQTLLAKGYRYNPSTGATDSMPYFQPFSALYAGGMYSTARDLSRYLSFQLESGPSPLSKVLSPESRAMMRYLKLAWKPAYPFVLHEGAIPGYSSIVVFNPDLRTGWVILTNISDVDFNQINELLAKVVMKSYNQQAVPAAAAYEGTYSLPGTYGSMKIFLKNDSLYSTYLQELLPNKPLIPEGRLRFKVEGGNGWNIGYEFVTDEHANITALKMGQVVWYKK